MSCRRLTLSGDWIIPAPGDSKIAVENLNWIWNLIQNPIKRWFQKRFNCCSAADSNTDLARFQLLIRYLPSVQAALPIQMFS